MKIKREVLAMAWLAVVVAAAGVSGHGLLTKPGGRSFKAWEDTQRGWPYGPRQPEWNPHSMNRGGVCGTSQTDATRNYNNPKDVNGNPFTPPVTDTYEAGQVYDFEFIITAHHYGHVELRLCRDWRRPTQACFDAHPLEFVSDELYGALPDPRHPERGYMAPANHIERRVPPSGGAFEGGMQFRMKFRIPLSIGRCDHCALQWTYVTANSCLVGGYRQYDFPDPSWWAGHLPDCEQTENWPRDGSAFPEQFWNCADVRIVPSGSSTPLPAPAPRPLPVPERKPLPVPEPKPLPAPEPKPLPAPELVPRWGACGGRSTEHCRQDKRCSRCAHGWACKRESEWYWQCLPRRSSSSSRGATVTSRPATTLVPRWGACGGRSTDHCRQDKRCSRCAHGWTCTRETEWYWQCLP